MYNIYIFNKHEYNAFNIDLAVFVNNLVYTKIFIPHHINSGLEFFIPHKV